MSLASPIIAPPSNSLPELPRFSLAPQVFDWCQRYIRQPDGPDSGGEWVFTAEQKRFLWYLYAIDRTGRFLWSRAVLRRAKGWGKSPYMAAIALAELCGPVRFGGWKGDNPIAVPVSVPHVQIAGISEKQTANTMSMVLAMIHESPIIDDYGLDPGLTRIYTESKGKLEPITASAQTAEGARPSFVVLDETHLWKEADGGHKLAQVIRRNLGKSRDGAARSVETTNAHEMGLDSVAERSYNAWQAQVTGAARGQSILYDSREAPPDMDLDNEGSLQRGLSFAYGDSVWVDLERIKEEIWDPGTPPSEARRFYGNQLVVAEDAWVTPQEWNRLETATTIDPEDEWTAGFDGSKSDDWTALVICRVRDSYIMPVGIWNPAQFGGTIPTAQVDFAVRKMFEQYDIVGFYADRAEFESYVDGWDQDFGDRLCVRSQPHHSVKFDMVGRKKETTEMVEAFHAAIVDGFLSHNGDKMLAAHVHNARRRPNSYGINIGKDATESPRKIDAAIAAVLARKARQDYLALPEKRRRRKRSGKAVFFA